MISLKYSFIFLLVIFYNNVSGQSKNDEVRSSLKNNLNQKELTGRFNILGLTDIFDENISLGVEYTFHEHWSTGTDAAYIFDSYYLSQKKGTSGFMVRPFIRFYPDKKRIGFYEAELQYKFAAYRITDWLGRDATNGVPAYEEYTTFSYKKRVYGINIKAGRKEDLSRDKKFKMELYIGLGFRYKTQGVDNGTYVRRGNFINFYNPEYSTITVPLGVRFLYDFN
ncbi:MAG: DUF3575 domain-containing protein [Bacteroidota bacterium]|nr:DUF3575 domain-containing protein [Bacteroidota bacterium]